jgi:sulfur-oxidizing protein SoxY
MDQVTQLYMPAHFVNKVKVSLDGEAVFSAETDISVSENPNFRFYLVPQGGGELIAEVEDTHGSKFTEAYKIAPARIAAHQ